MDTLLRSVLHLKPRCRVCERASRTRAVSHDFERVVRFLLSHRFEAVMEPLLKQHRVRCLADLKCFDVSRLGLEDRALERRLREAFAVIP